MPSLRNGTIHRALADGADGVGPETLLHSPTGLGGGRRVAQLAERLQAAVAGRFTLDRKIGQGGWAVVYLAYRRDSGAPVAVKVLRPEYAPFIAAARFEREVAVLATLRHPNILPLLESGQAGPLPYYIMPYAVGRSLRDRLEREPQLPLAAAIEIVRWVASALDYAHARNIVHRDIKPDNVLFLDDRPMVADFGIARAIVQAGGEELSSSGMVPGTPEYMSPEQAAGIRELDGRSDLFSLGCMLYEILAGQPPFRGASLQAIVARRMAASVPPLRVVRPDVPPHVERGILAALAERRDDRPESGSALMEMLLGG
jgi:serine/threonine protein kinase